MKDILEHLLAGEHLDVDRADTLLRALAAGDVPPVMAGALLTAMRAKGEHPDEILGFARAMRALAIAPEIPAEGPPLVDTCGTGGDGSHSLNLSTGAALLAAAAGLRVVKHGNRSISSRSGSADVLEALGARLANTAGDAAHLLERTGFTFLFAPNHHPAMRAIMPVRRALGVRTVFNVLGPLSNPARPPYQVIGAFSADAARRMASAVAGLGLRRCFVVHGAEGWDEATPVGPFLRLDVQGSAVSESMVDPADHGIPRCTTADLAGGDSTYNASRLAAVLRGEEQGPHRDALCLGAALALEVTGEAEDLATGFHAAGRAIDTGGAATLLSALSDG